MIPKKFLVKQPVGVKRKNRNNGARAFIVQPAQLLIILALICLAGCRLSPLDDRSPTEAIVIPTPLPTATSVVIHRPLSPTATLIPPTAMPLPEHSDGYSDTTGPCSYEYFFEPAPVTCPKGQSTNSFAAEQSFESGVMIWLEATDSIYVFYKGEQQWQRFDDAFEEGQPESDPAFEAPTGRFQPIRGFGKVWREHPEVRHRLGWAVGVELAYEATIQEQAYDEFGDEVVFLRTFNGQVFALIRRGLDQGDWVIAVS
jgi:hypothetical protein